MQEPIGCVQFRLAEVEIVNNVPPRDNECVAWCDSKCVAYCIGQVILGNDREIRVTEDALFTSFLVGIGHASKIGVIVLAFSSVPRATERLKPATGKWSWPTTGSRRSTRSARPTRDATRPLPRSARRRASRMSATCSRSSWPRSSHACQDATERIQPIVYPGTLKRENREK